VDQLVVNPGPVIELMRSDIPPMNPMPGDGGGSIVEMNEPAIQLLERERDGLLLW
jgi:hypothetical protein